MLFRRRDDSDFRREIDSHLEIETDRLIDEGMDPIEARAAARRAFGNIANHQERFYESIRWLWLDGLQRAFRSALRRVGSSPVSATIIVLSLAVGIGVNTAIFSLADQALIRKLPVVDPGGLVQIQWSGRFIGGTRGYGSLLSHPLFRQARQQADVFSDVFARTWAKVSLAVGVHPERVPVELVSGSYFASLGVEPALGRLIAEDDDRHPGAHPVLVLSHDLWRSHFGLDPGVLGRTVRVNDTPMTIIGVAEPGFYGTDWALGPAAWLPLMMSDLAIGGNRLEKPRERFLHVFGRLVPGMTRDRAAVEIQPWFQSVLHSDMQREDWPQRPSEQDIEEYLASSLVLAPGGRGHSHLESNVRQPMLILCVATALLLLLACLNAANLSLARALSRHHETALRAALGASRRHIACLQALESALLAAGGGVLGILIGPFVGRLILSFLGNEGVGHIKLHSGIDVRVLLIAIATTALVTILSGVAPAMFSSSVHPIQALAQRAGGVAGGFRIRKALVVAQFTLALTLLVVAGGFLRTLGALQGKGPGFDTENLITFSVTPVNDGYDVDESKAVTRALLENLRAQPMFESVGVAVFEILAGGGWGDPITVESPERVAREEAVEMNAVDPGFFTTIGTPLLAGRNFNSSDLRLEPEWGLRSAIVDEEFVRQYVPSGDPIGARIGFGSREDVIPRIEIIGVVRGFQDHSLREPAPQVFFSIWERSVDSAAFYVRTRNSVEAASRAVHTAVREVDAALTVTDFRTMHQRIDLLLSYEHMLATLATVFAAMATLLAVVGLYGVMSFTAISRTKEIGIRMAIGASPWSAGRLIVREAVMLALAGMAIALPLTWFFGRSLESRFFGVRPMDVMTIFVSAALLFLVCLPASVLPAYRVSRMNPLAALRSE